MVLRSVVPGKGRTAHAATPGRATARRPVGRSGAIIAARRWRRRGQSGQRRPHLTRIRWIVRRATRPPGLGGLHPLLFAAYPVLFLWSQNVAELAPGEIVAPLVAVVAATTLATVAIGFVLGDRRRAALIVTPVVLGALLYGHVATVTGVPEEIRLLGWLGVVGLAAVGAGRLGARRLASIDTALVRLGIVALAVPLVMIVPHEVEDALVRPAPVVARAGGVASITDAPKRDVYWIVLDRYGSDRSFELRFGTVNAFTPWLRERGFTVLADSHANYVATSLSMATTLNMTHLEELTGLVGSASSSYTPVYERLQAPRVVEQFKALGYRYVHLGSWWNPTRRDVAADVNYNADLESEIVSLLVQYSVATRVVETFDLEEVPPSESAKHLKHNRFALDVLDRLPAERGPKFVLAHILLPHPPYVFDRNGRYIPVDEAATLDETDAWQRQLDYTNSRLRAFVEQLLAMPESDRPIVILQADEGPWTEPYAASRDTYDWQTASPDELEMKFGILNAWYVPGADLALDPAMSAINTFPVLFDRYFGLEYEPLDTSPSTTASRHRAAGCGPTS
jgi:hypothetical protein